MIIMLLFIKLCILRYDDFFFKYDSVAWCSVCLTHAFLESPSSLNEYVFESVSAFICVSDMSVGDTLTREH